MLVLTHKPGEKIYVGDNVLLRVLSVHGTDVRVGYEAPKEVGIIRENAKKIPPNGGYCGR